MKRPDVRRMVAVGCRILAQENLVIEALGHISARTASAGEMWLRCRRTQEFGIRSTTRTQIRRISLESLGGKTGDGYFIPLEFPIHAELLKARPEIVLCAAAGVPLRPVYGSFDWSGLQLLSDGIATYPRARLVDDRRAAKELVSAMDGRDVCIMQGHGATVVGATVEDAVLKAVRLERLARFCWELACVAPGSGGLEPEDLAGYAERSDVIGRTGRSGAWNSYASQVVGRSRISPLW
jgi:ribulose-5-phosphate 4-epimerase/fuculose-1-phosphate aldolase